MINGKLTDHCTKKAKPDNEGLIQFCIQNLQVKHMSKFRNQRKKLQNFMF